MRCSKPNSLNAETRRNGEEFSNHNDTTNTT